MAVLSNVRESFLIHEREDVLSGELVMKFGLRQSINPISHIYARSNNYLFAIRRLSQWSSSSVKRYTATEEKFCSRDENFW